MPWEWDSSAHIPINIGSHFIGTLLHAASRNWASRRVEVTRIAPNQPPYFFSASFFLLYAPLLPVLPVVFSMSLSYMTP